MRATGYGSWVQEIVVHVDREHMEEVAALLGTHPFKEAGHPVRAYFMWNRTTTRAGNDEDVVFDLFRLLGDPADRLDWCVNWDTSQY